MALDEVTIREAEPRDIAPVRALLLACKLPVDGVPEEADLLLVADRGGQVVGVAGLELHGGDGLLRSVAVSPELRGQRIAENLCARIEHRAIALGLRRVYLLTETAEQYFVRRGYRVGARSEAPPAIAASREFAESCPASARFMVRPV